MRKAGSKAKNAKMQRLAGYCEARSKAIQPAKRELLLKAVVLRWSSRILSSICYSKAMMAAAMPGVLRFAEIYGALRTRWRPVATVTVKVSQKATNRSMCSGEEKETLLTVKLSLPINYWETDAGYG